MLGVYMHEMYNVTSQSMKSLQKQNLIIHIDHTVFCSDTPFDFDVTKAHLHILSFGMKLSLNV